MQKRKFPFFLLPLILLLCIAAPALCTDGQIRFVQISDVHFNPERGNVKGRMVKHSGDLLRDAVQQVNSMPDIDFVVFTGDLVDHPSEKLIQRFAAEANKLKVPWFYAQGNHDAGPGFSRAKFRKTMSLYNKNQQSTSDCTVFRGKGFLFFFMDGPIDDEVTAQGRFSSDALGILSRVLAENPDTPAAVFQHFPVVYPFSSKSHSVRNDAEYLKILDARPNVKAVFTGHFHTTNVKQRNGVAHIATPALVQYPNAFRVMTMTRLPGGGVSISGAFAQTRLASVQAASKSASGSSHSGKPQDRDFTLTLK